MHRPLERWRPHLKSYGGWKSAVVAWFLACTMNGWHPEHTDIDLPLYTASERRKCLPKCGRAVVPVQRGLNSVVSSGVPERRSPAYSQGMRRVSHEDRHP